MIKIIAESESAEITEPRGSEGSALNNNKTQHPVSSSLICSVCQYICRYLADVGSVEGLAYHRAWDTLYWTSSTTSSITRHTVDQRRRGAFNREAVITMAEDDHPHVLALDECQK